MSWINYAKLPRAGLLAAALSLAATMAVAEMPKWGPDGKLLPLSDGFPNGPIHVWNTQPPGHADEAEARVLAKAAAKYTAVPVVVDSAAAGPLIHFAWMNRLQTMPGGKDGYHVAVGSLNGIVQRLFTFDIKYDLQDTKDATLYVAAYTANMLVGRPSAGFKNIQDVVAWAKAHPNKLRVATCSIGCGLQITMESFARTAGFKYRVIPTEGTAQAVLTMEGGGAEAATAGPSYALPLVKQGKVQPLLTWAPRRSKLFPNVPTGTELHYGAGVPRSVGLVTYPTVSADHKAWLLALFKKAYGDPIYTDFNEKRGYEPLGYEGAKKDQFIQDLYDTLGPVTVDLGLATKKVTAAWKKDHSN